MWARSGSKWVPASDRKNLAILDVGHAGLYERSSASASILRQDENPSTKCNFLALQPFRVSPCRPSARDAGRPIGGPCRCPPMARGCRTPFRGGVVRPRALRWSATLPWSELIRARRSCRRRAAGSPTATPGGRRRRAGTCARGCRRSAPRVRSGPWWSGPWLRSPAGNTPGENSVLRLQLLVAPADLLLLYRSAAGRDQTLAVDRLDHDLADPGAQRTLARSRSWAGRSPRSPAPAGAARRPSPQSRSRVSRRPGRGR